MSAATCESCTDAMPVLCASCAHLESQWAARKERARIRKLIMPALRDLLGAMGTHRPGWLFHAKCDHDSCAALRAIDAATRRETARL